MTKQPQGQMLLRDCFVGTHFAPPHKGEIRAFLATYPFSTRAKASLCETWNKVTVLSFEEYLINSGNQLLYEQLQEHDFNLPFPDALHQRSLQLLQQYLAIGGMPEAVNTFVETQDYRRVEQVQNDLLLTYRHDFPKYVRRDSEFEHVDLTFSRIPQLVGKRFKYVQLSRDIRARYLQKAIDLLTKAEIVTRVSKSTGAVPLGATTKPNRFKLLFLDVGLMQRALKLDIASWLQGGYSVIHSGQVAEQYVGQQLRCQLSSPAAELFYWERDKQGSSAEVDFLLELYGSVYPIEVKAGKFGRLKSMHIFLESNPQAKEALKVSIDNFAVSGRLRSIPLYAFGEWLREHL